MTSLILNTTTRFLIGLFLLFSLFLLFRGHNLPGGGFVGGLVAAAAYALYCIAFGVREARGLLRVDPRTLVGIGLGLAMISGCFAFFRGLPYLTGLWGKNYWPVIGRPGTPLVFDIGVYLLVIGFALLIIFTLSEQDTGDKPKGPYRRQRQRR